MPTDAWTSYCNSAFFQTSPYSSVAHNLWEWEDCAFLTTAFYRDHKYVINNGRNNNAWSCTHRPRTCSSSCIPGNRRSCSLCPSGSVLGGSSPAPFLSWGATSSSASCSRSTALSPQPAHLQKSIFLCISENLTLNQAGVQTPCWCTGTRIMREKHDVQNLLSQIMRITA